MTTELTNCRRRELERGLFHKPPRPVQLERSSKHRLTKTLGSYVVIKNSPDIADFYHRLVTQLGKCSNAHKVTSARFQDASQSYSLEACTEVSYAPPLLYS
jgi:hypothetical protein